MVIECYRRSYKDLGGFLGNLGSLLSDNGYFLGDFGPSRTFWVFWDIIGSSRTFWDLLGSYRTFYDLL